MRQSKVPAVRFVISILAILFVSYPSSYLRSQDIPMEFQVKRVEKYNFTKTPTVNLVGENYVIEFESEAFCDVTVAVENLEGYIVRHLASGVLGDNAPEPFVKGSLSQKIIWDQKGDDEKYIDDIENMVIRVSLGLKPIFEKTLFGLRIKELGERHLFLLHTRGVF